MSNIIPAVLIDAAEHVKDLHALWVNNEDDDIDEDLRYEFIDAAYDLAVMITDTEWSTDND